MINKIHLFSKQFYHQHARLLSKGPFSIFIRMVKHFRNKAIIRRQQYRSKKILTAIFGAVLATKPYSCNPQSLTEIHTLTAHHHLPMYITALKSFLRFFHDVAIVTHDDGSLTLRDMTIIRHHIPGIRIITRTTADKKMADLLAGAPHSARFRSSIVNSMELFDNILLAERPKIITMNSDVLFIEEPREVLDWINSDDAIIRSVYEEDPAEQKAFLAKRSCGVAPNITLCLVCFYKEIFNLEYVEQVVASENKNWFTAQNIYPLLFEKASAELPVAFFDKNTYQSSGEFPDGAVFRHYWTSTGRFTALQTTDSAAVIRSL